MAKTVKVTYNAETLETTILVDGKPFDTSRIDGKEIEDWAYPFMMRKVRWNGFYDEMVDALGGEAEFNLVFDGSEDALNELREAWEDAPVNVVSGESVAVITYDETTLSTEITVNDIPLDTSRINGKEIEDWVYPFTIRKVKWNGIFEELATAIGSEEYTIRFSGSNAAMKVLMEECPDTVQILKEKNSKKTIPVAPDIPPMKEIKEDDSSHQGKNFHEVNPVQKIERHSQDVAVSKAIYENGKKCYLWGDYKQAFEYFKEAADAGNSEAQLALGDCYRFSKGVVQNYAESLRYYAKSAEQGNPYAQFEVGCCFYHGEGIQMNRTAALEFYFSSAELGNGVAREMLWFLAEQGDDTAYELYRRLTPLPPKPKKQKRKESYYPSTTPARYVTSSTHTVTSIMNEYIQGIDAKQAVKFGVKVGSGVLKIASVLSGVPMLGMAASATEKAFNGLVDGDFSEISNAVEDIIGLITNDDE